MRRAALATAAALVTATVLAIGGCSGDGVLERGTAGPDGGLTGLLTLVPDEGDASAFVVVNDLERAAETAEIDRPPTDADEDELADWFTALSTDEEPGLGAAPFGNYGISAIEGEAWREEFGFSLADVDADILAGEPPGNHQAFVGDFDEDAVDEAVESDPAWNELLETTEYDGLTYYSWGEDEEINPGQVSDVRRLGESLRLFVDGEAGVAYLARSTEVMEENLDAFLGEATNLAEHELIGPMAEALDDAGAHSAVLSDDDEAIDQISESADEGPALAPYDAFATGAALIDGHPHLVVVLANPDEETAEANADRLADVVANGESGIRAEPWSEVLGDGRIDTDGRLTIGVFPTERFRLWFEVVLQRDSLLATE